MPPRTLRVQSANEVPCNDGIQDPLIILPGGGGGTSVIEGDRDVAAGQGMILPVINIGTGVIKSA